MIHAREDYNRFQDPDNKIPQNEPVFLFRAQDKHFIKVLKYYQFLLWEDSPTSSIIDLIDKHIELSKDWPTKTPDV